jgi:tetratricopeptide (TPR) repeat protein
MKDMEEAVGSLKWIGFIALVAVVSMGAKAFADDVDDCNGDVTELVLKGCTVIIDDNHASKSNLEAALVSRDLAFDQKKDWDKALADLSKAVELDPKDANAFYNRGVVYEHRGDGELAITDYTKAIALNPKDPDAHFGRGNVYYYSDDFDNALKDYEMAIKLNPKHGTAILGRGLTYEQLGKPDKAEADFKKAIALSDDEEVVGDATEALKRLTEE